jgi:hypothetical protein
MKPGITYTEDDTQSPVLPTFTLPPNYRTETTFALDSISVFLSFIDNLCEQYIYLFKRAETSLVAHTCKLLLPTTCVNDECVYESFKVNGYTFQSPPLAA